MKNYIVVQIEYGKDITKVFFHRVKLRSGISDVDDLNIEEILKNRNYIVKSMEKKDKFKFALHDNVRAEDGIFTVMPHNVTVTAFKRLMNSSIFCINPPNNRGFINSLLYSNYIDIKWKGSEDTKKDTKKDIKNDFNLLLEHAAFRRINRIKEFLKRLIDNAVPKWKKDNKDQTYLSQYKEYGDMYCQTLYKKLREYNSKMIEAYGIKFVDTKDPIINPWVFLNFCMGKSEKPFMVICSEKNAKSVYNRNDLLLSENHSTVLAPAYEYLLKKGGTMLFNDIKKYFEKTYGDYKEVLVDLMVFYGVILEEGVKKSERKIFTRRNHFIHNACYDAIYGRIMIKNTEEKKNFYSSELTDEQNDAVEMAINNKISVLTGAAGSGKTHTIIKLVKYLIDNKIRVQMTSFTGKAVVRMKELLSLIDYSKKKDLLNVPATMHRLLESETDFDFLIIDESTMVENELFCLFIKKYNDRKIPILFVGDNHQLQPIGNGCLFFTLYSLNEVIPITNLTKNFRISAEADDSLLSNIASLRTTFPNFEESGNFYIENTESDAKSYELCKGLVKKFHKEGLRSDCLRFLSFFNEPIRELNNIVCREYFGNGSHKYYKDQLVISTENDYEHGIFNGEEGRVTEIGSNSVTVKYISGGKSVNYHISEISKITCAYATSVHKAQGSEYDVIVLFLPYRKKDVSTFLSKNLLYTALSRSKLMVYIIGNSSMLEKCFHAKTDIVTDSVYDSLFRNLNIEKKAVELDEDVISEVDYGSEPDFI